MGVPLLLMNDDPQGESLAHVVEEATVGFCFLLTPCSERLR